MRKGDRDSLPSERGEVIAGQEEDQANGERGGLGPLDPTGVDRGSGPSGSIGQGASAWPLDR